MVLQTKWSEALFERAQAALPGGVSSPVRAFGHVGGTPLFIRSGHGALIEDEDGNHFVDYCMSWGPLVLGHAHAGVIRAIAEAAQRGTTFGAPTVPELALAELIRQLYPAVERLRFVSSGTEAVMSAVRVARAATKRDLIVKFDGCYHGHADYLLVKAGSGLATSGVPDSAGVPAAIAALTRVLPLGDPAAFSTFMREHGREVAAVLIEGVPANAGLLVQDESFVRLIREECTSAGALFLLDEVITGFRLGPGGAAARYGITPDLVTFGKVIGGGLPVGAYGGRADLMSLVAPIGPVYQAGTLSGNPVAMMAGKATLDELRTGGWDLLEERSRALEAALRPVVAAARGPVQLLREGSIFWLAFQDKRPHAWSEVDRASAARYAAFHRALLKRGVYLPPSAFEVFFASTVLTDEQIANTAHAFREALKAKGGKQ